VKFTLLLTVCTESINSLAEGNSQKYKTT